MEGGRERGFKSNSSNTGSNTIHRKEKIFVNGEQQPLAASMSNVITRGKKEKKKEEIETKENYKRDCPLWATRAQCMPLLHSTVSHGIHL